MSVLKICGERELRLVENNNNFYEEVMSHSEFYSLMYPDYVKSLSTEKQIISIKTSSVRQNPAKTTFYYVWGWPGPDCNMYNNENYGKTWAFIKEELMEYWKED